MECGGVEAWRTKVSIGRDGRGLRRIPCDQSEPPPVAGVVPSTPRPSKGGKAAPPSQHRVRSNDPWSDPLIDPITGQLSVEKQLNHLVQLELGQSSHQRSRQTKLDC